MSPGLSPHDRAVGRGEEQAAATLSSRRRVQVRVSGANPDELLGQAVGLVSPKVPG